MTENCVKCWVHFCGHLYLWKDVVGHRMFLYKSPLFYACYLLLPDKTNTQYLLNLDSKMKKNLSNSLLFVPTTHWCMQSRRGCTPIIQGQNWNSYNSRSLLYSLVIVNLTKKPHEFCFFSPVIVDKAFAALDLAIGYLPENYVPVNFIDWNDAS